MEQKYIQTAIDYKKNIAGKFVLVEGAKLKQRVEIADNIKKGWEEVQAP